jgi:hypothetical protein
VEKTDRAQKKAAVGRRRHGERGRRAATLGHGGDAGRRPASGHCEERRGGTAERCCGVVVERMSGRRVAFEEEECTRGYDVGPLG